MDPESTIIEGTTSRDGRWPQALEEFDRLLTLPPVQRYAALDRLRVERTDLYRFVQTLLRANADAESGGFLAPDPPEPAASDELMPGMVLGVYRLECPIGTGGMGKVWLARRADGLFETPVALKLLHPHLSHSVLRERFVREGRILGQMAHSNIAHLLDAGVLPDGQLYLALEYVQGERLDRWCDEHRLGIRARVELFIKVCNAIAHAHAHLVVHRDLKPSNILVAQDGAPKLLDFGIAKLVQDEAEDSQETELTRLGGRAMTPDFAAPEQVLGGPITVATDIYSLGVILYQLLSGRRPYGGAGKSASQLERDVVEVEPSPLSQTTTRIPSGLRSNPSETPNQPSVDELAELRDTTPSRLREMLRGDLDVIVAKCMKKTPGDRYLTVPSLIADLRRYLDDEPILARPDSFGYRARKFAKRYRAGVAATFLVLISLLGGMATTAWQAHRATVAAALAESARNEALARRMQADDLIDFMLGDLRDRLAEVGRLDVLDAAVTKATEYLKPTPDQPTDPDALGQRIRALDSIADIRNNQSQVDAAVAAGQQAMVEAQLLPNDGKPDTDLLRTFALRARGVSLMESENYDAALQYLRQGIDNVERVRSTRPDDESVALLEADLDSAIGVSLASTKHFDQAVAPFDACIELAQHSRCAPVRNPTPSVSTGVVSATVFQPWCFPINWIWR